jgi:hypothetical protein
MAEQKLENNGPVEIDAKDLLNDEEKPLTPLDRILRRIKKAQADSGPGASGSHKDLSKDKSKSLLIVVVSAVAALLFLLAHFSSPQKAHQDQGATHRGQPDLGRRITPGEEQKQAGSVVPMLTADMRDQQAAKGDQLTPEDISRLSHMTSPTSIVKPPNVTANALVPSEVKPAKNSQYALSHIDFSDPELQQRYAQAERSPNLSQAAAPLPPVASSEPNAELKKSSLVFISSQNNTVTDPAMHLEHASTESARTEAAEAQTVLPGPVLPAGTRLVARLESPASTAVASPVIAAIEYNYERDGEIVVPAGSKALGKLEQANSSGYVSLRFTAIQFPDGTTAKMDGTSMGLDFEPVKGLVSGKRRGSRFIVQSLTGVGSVAAYLVGANNLNGPISNEALLRERLADNVAIAGQNEMNQVAFNQNIMVTVPGNTRFYIVFQEIPNSPGQQLSSQHVTSRSGSTAGNQSAPNLEELRQLLQLREELSQLYQQNSSEQAAPVAAQQP